ncbi:MAG: mannitol dehydrogenase family protein [Clostridiales Family XIII bacterium]|jgi:fructuronate reductase|nr:mannitol dehydrogenase family protein [Clostridiales Family XIII bacterium]
MKLAKETLGKTKEWEAIGVALPAYDAEHMRAATKEAPVWVHFGAGNIFRGFIAVLQQRLLDRGLTDKGIVAAECFDTDIIDEIYAPYDDLTLLVGLRPDGGLEKEIVASISESIKTGDGGDRGMERLTEIFKQPSLQLVSLTVTEKGYAIWDGQLALIPPIQKDIEKGPDSATHVISVLTALLYRRYRAGGYPIALVSMDNCSRNGEKLREAIVTVAEQWRERGYVDAAFFAWLTDNASVRFPWTMIDKITPRPDESVCRTLEADGVEGMTPVITSKNTFIAPFVNAEIPQYLVVEDDFPAGRPPLEQAGVLFADRETVSNCERMKVTVCLNPLHTALAVYGCLLGYTRIYEEMKDPALVRLIEGIGYREGLKVVTNPGIIDPKVFMKEVIEQRLPNPYIPDAPQRIATDTGLKIPIRFGETMKAYTERPDLDIATLHFIPLAIAGWLRYVLAVDDRGQRFEPSPDPTSPILREALSDIIWNDSKSYKGQLLPILRNADIFGIDLVANGLSEKIEDFFVDMLAGEGAVRASLEKHTTKKSGENLL